MKSTVTTKKKLELKKTAIANLSLTEAQMRMVVGGDGGKNTRKLSGDKVCQQLSDSCIDANTHCTGIVAIDTL